MKKRLYFYLFAIAVSLFILVSCGPNSLKISEDGLVRYKRNAFTNPYIEVPPEIRKITVTGIEDYGFSSVSERSSREVYEHLEKEHLFYSISLPDTLETIGEGAFSGITLLESFDIPQSVQYIGSRAFMYCKGLTEVTLPEGLTEIKESTFEECKNLSKVVIPSTVRQICKDAFAHCMKLKSVIIPEGVIRIDPEAFLGCYLDEVTFPSTLTIIDRDAFRANNLKSITIPASVTYIGEGAFCCNYDLETIYYEGTKEQWKAITRGEDVFLVYKFELEKAPNRTIITTDGTIKITYKKTNTNNTTIIQSCQHHWVPTEQRFVNGKKITFYQCDICFETKRVESNY